MGSKLSQQIPGVDGCIDASGWLVGSVSIAPDELGGIIKAQGKEGHFKEGMALLPMLQSSWLNAD